MFLRHKKEQRHGDRHSSGHGLDCAGLLVPKDYVSMMPCRVAREGGDCYLYIDGSVRRFPCVELGFFRNFFNKSIYVVMQYYCKKLSIKNLMATEEQLLKIAFDVVADSLSASDWWRLPVGGTDFLANNSLTASLLVDERSYSICLSHCEKLFADWQKYFEALTGVAYSEFRQYLYSNK